MFREFLAIINIPFHYRSWDDIYLQTFHYNKFASNDKYLNIFRYIYCEYVYMSLQHISQYYLKIFEINDLSY